MTTKIVLGFLAVIAVGIIPALAEIDSPLKQYESGVSIHDIQCRDSKILMETQRGTPACVSWETAQKMQQRGWIVMWAAPLQDVNVPVEPTMITIVPDSQNQDYSAGAGGRNMDFKKFPNYNLTFPDQVKMGEKFDVVLDYSWTINVPCLEYPENYSVPLVVNVDEPQPKYVKSCIENTLFPNGTIRYVDDLSKETCAGSCLERLQYNNLTFYVGRNAYVELLDDDGLELYSRTNNTDYRPIREFEMHTMTPVFDHTTPHQRTFSFAIHEPDTEYPFGVIAIDTPSIPHGVIHFYVKPDGTVQLDDEKIEPIVLASGVQIPQLVKHVELPEIVDSLSGMAGLETREHMEGMIHMLGPSYEEGGLSGEDIESELQHYGFTDEFIGLFFELYPDLRTQSSDPTLASSHSFFSTVYGRVSHFDIDNNIVSLKNTRVCAYDTASNPLTRNNVHICDDTDTSGMFELPNIPKHLGQMSFGVHAIGDDVSVVENAAGNAFSDIIGGTVLNDDRQFAGHSVVPRHGDAGLAFKLFGELEKIDQWYKDELDYDPPSVTARWDPTLCEPPSASPNNTMTFQHITQRTDRGDRQCPDAVSSSLTSKDTIAHEFGHIAFYDKYLSQNSRLPESHYDHNPSHNPAVYTAHADAWSEGWAFFMAIVYSGSEEYQPDYMHGQWNFEDRTTNESGLRDRPFAKGIGGEGSITAVLWDAYDNTNERGDNRQNQLSNIWNTLSDELEPDERVIANDFFEFKDDWDDNHYPSLDSIYELNEITEKPLGIQKIFFEPFDNLDAWTETGDGNWRVGSPDEGGQPPGHGLTNTVATVDDCDNMCVLMTDVIDLTGYSHVYLSAFTFEDDDFEADEYTQVGFQSSDGGGWLYLDPLNQPRGEWNTWRYEIGDDATDFRLGIRAHMDHSGDDGMVDSILLTGIPSVSTYENDFDAGLSSWMVNDGIWADTPDERVPGSTNANLVVTSSRCTFPICDIELNAKLDTRDPLEISFKKFISDNVSYLDGLETYYHDGTIWNPLAFYTAHNGNNTGVWEDESLMLDIPEDSAKFRFVIHIDSPDEVVEIDDFSVTIIRDTAPVISPIPDQSLRHTSVLNIPVTATDAENHPIVLSLVNPPGFVSISGDTILIDPEASDAGIHTITVRATANSLTDEETFEVLVTNPPSSGRKSVTDRFNDLTPWTNLRTVNWESDFAKVAVPGSPATNKVLTSSDCDDECILMLKSDLDTTDPLSVSFKRFVDRSIDRDEGLYVQYSTDGAVWENLATYTDNNNEDTGSWTDESLMLDIPEDAASFRLLAMSDRSNEAVEMDDLVIGTPDTAPVISDISNQELPHTEVRTVRVTATDAENHSIVLSLVNPPGFVSISGDTIRIDPTASDAGTHTITVRATANSLTSEKSFTVRVTVPSDAVSPVITPPPDRTFEATGASTTITDTQLGTATATDNVDPNPVITHDSSGSFGVGVHTITWTATDSSGNSASATQTITIQDTVVPNIALVGNQTIMIDQGSTYEEQSATCTDNIDGTLSVRQQGIVDTRTSGEYTVTYSCTDNSGNSASVSRTITVSQPSTTHVITPADFEHQTSKLYWDCPEVICPSSERSGSEHVQYLKFDISPSTVNDGDTILFTDGTYDLPGPIVLQHANLTIRSDDGSGVTIRSTDNKGLIFRNVGDVSGLEISGLEMSSSRTTKSAPARNFGMVFIEDTTGHDDIKILDNTFRGNKQNGIRIGSSDQASVFTNIEIRGNTFEAIPADRTPVHLSNADVTLFANTFEISDYVHHDGAGSLADLHNFYPGKPDSAPVVTPPPDVELEATGPLTAVTPEQLGTATAIDDTDPSPVISNDSPGSFAVGNHTITWTATDSARNSGTATQTVTIKDTTPPAVTLLGDSRVTVEKDGTYEELSATCIDIVDGSLSITTNGTVDTSMPGEYTLEYSCTDTAGNPASVTRTVTVLVLPPLPQPTDLGIVNEYDLSNGWRMMTIDWTEPSQSPASGYELTVTSANGTLLSLSQFEILTSSEYDGLVSYKMHGTRNQQGDIANISSSSGMMTIHNNMLFVLDGREAIQIYELNGTHTQTITSLSFAPSFNNGMTIDDGKLWVANRGGPPWDPIIYPVDLTATGVLDAFPPNTGDGFAPHASQDSVDGVASHDGTLYVTDQNNDRVFAYDTAGTYIPSKSFDLPPPGHNRNVNPTSITAEATTGMIYVYDYWGEKIFVYSGADDDGTRRLLFSFDVSGLYRYASPAVMPTITSDTITIPAGSSSTTYYYHTPANETVTHTVQLAVPSSEPPATITTPKN